MKIKKMKFEMVGICLAGFAVGIACYLVGSPWPLYGLPLAIILVLMIIG